MDIDATLRELREISEHVQAVLGSGEKIDGEVERMCELFDELDAHLQQGGMLPLAWKRTNPQKGGPR